MKQLDPEVGRLLCLSKVNAADKGEKHRRV